MNIYVGNFYSWDIREKKCDFHFLIVLCRNFSFACALSLTDKQAILVRSYYYIHFFFTETIERSTAAKAFSLSATVMFLLVYINSSLWTPSRIAHQQVVKTVRGRGKEEHNKSTEWKFNIRRRVDVAVVADDETSYGILIVSSMERWENIEEF